MGEACWDVLWSRRVGSILRDRVPLFQAVYMRSSECAVQMSWVSFFIRDVCMDPISIRRPRVLDADERIADGGWTL